MDTALWTVQGIIGAMFLMFGFMKIAKSKSELQDKMAWVEDFSEGSIKAIGAVEMIGAIGIILPAIIDTVPILTAVAAFGLCATMLVAATVHVRRKEYAMIGMNAMLFALAGFVGYGRLILEPFN